MTRTSRTVVAAVVVLAALASGLAPVAAAAGAPSADAGAAQATSGPASAPAIQEDCSFPVTVTDATGTEVTLEEPPEDVVVLGASSAQIVWELGEQEHVVGMPVGPSTSYLEGSQNRTHVLDGIRVQTETVVDLDPDLVIAPGIIAPEDVQALRDAGLTVYAEGPAGSMDDIRNRTTTTGRLVGACEEADETVQWMNDRLETVDEAVGTVEEGERPSVFYWLGGGFTAGNGTFQGELIERAGARNAAANMSIQGWAQASPEAIVAEDPDYILVTEGTELPEDHAIQQTTAVQEGNVIRVDTNYWNQPAPRVVLAVENITAQLHGEELEQARADEEENSIPGFGVAAGVVALLATGLAVGLRD